MQLRLRPRLRMLHGLRNGSSRGFADAAVHAARELLLFVFQPHDQRHGRRALRIPASAWGRTSLSRTSPTRPTTARTSPSFGARSGRSGSTPTAGRSLRDRLRLSISGSNYLVADPDTGIVYTFDSTTGLLQSVTPPGNPVSGEITTNSPADTSPILSTAQYAQLHSVRQRFPNHRIPRLHVFPVRDARRGPTAICHLTARSPPL